MVSSVMAGRFRPCPVCRADGAMRHASKTAMKHVDFLLIRSVVSSLSVISCLKRKRKKGSAGF